MSKNLTRKGIALGAAAALALTGLTTAPASAAETLSLAPSAGTAYKVLTTSDFKLAAGFAGNESAAATASLKYRVTNSSGATMTFDVVEAGVDTGAVADVVYSVGGNADATATDVVVSAGTTDAAIGSENSLIVSVTPVADTSVTLTVQAFLDIDGGNDIDAGESTSPVRTLVFADHASVTGSATVDSAAIGAGKLSAKVTLADINYDQLDSDDVKVEFFKNGTTVTDTNDSADSASGSGDTLYGHLTAAQRTNPVVAAWSAADSELRATLYPDINTAGGANTVYNIAPNVVGAVYSAKVFLNDGAAWVEVANSAGATTPAVGEVDSLSVITAIAGTDVATASLRAGAGSFKVKTTATPNTDKSAAGNVVTFKVAETSANSLAGTVTVGAKTLTNSSITTVQSFTVDVVTDADGVATLALSYSGVTNGKTFDISASALDTDAVETAAAVTFTAADSDVLVIADDVYAGQKANIAGQSFSVNYKIVDQFGSAPSGTFRLAMSEDSTSANYATTIDFNGGSATFSTTENSTAANSYSLTATVEQKNTDGTWDATPTAAGGALAETTSIQVYTAAKAVSTVAVSASDDGVAAAVALELDSTYSGNYSLQQSSVAFPTLTDVTTLTYTATASTGEVVAGAPVNVSAAGLQFAADSDTWFGVGSITGTTNASGQFVVKVYSNFSGKKVISATIGGVTKTQSVTFADAADNTATQVNLKAPTTIKSGRTLTLTGVIADKYGNGVSADNTSGNDENFVVSYTGPGFTSAAPTEAGTDGAFSMNVLIGSSDSGIATFTVKYDLNRDGDYTDATDLTVSKSVVVGVSATVSAGSKKANVVVKGAEGLTVKVVSGTKSTSKVATSDSYKLSLTKLTKGKKTVKVYVNDVLVTSKSVTVKK